MKQKAIEGLARFGLIAKGVVYILMGGLAFVAALRLGETSARDANQSAAFLQLKHQHGGSLILGILVAGLICYCAWRYIQAFSKSSANIKLVKRARYFFSGIAYSSLAYSAIRLLLHHQKGGDQQQQMAASFLAKPFGVIAVVSAAVIIASIGFYQVYYGMSGKYKKHVQQLNKQKKFSQLLLWSGKAGYIARAVVWLIVSYLLFKAALHSNASEAGNTGKAFQFVENGPMGSYFSAAIGLGLLTYGLFNFIRAKYEDL
jgi:hypothetical protein